MLRFIKRILITLIGFGFLWGVGLIAFTLAVPTAHFERAESVDAIVVLTGGPDRINYGLTLLAQHKGERLFISGVNELATVQEVLRQATTNVPEEMKPRVAIGRAANSTIGNAEETAGWIATNRVRSLRLVTANYHMPRSMVEFRAVLPRTVVIYPDPVFPDAFSTLGWWREDKTRTLVLSEYHKTLAALLRHLILRLESNT